MRLYSMARLFALELEINYQWQKYLGFQCGKQVMIIIESYISVIKYGYS